MLVKMRLTQDLVCHGSEIICESLDNFGVLMILKAPKVSHVDENEIVELNPEMAALLNEH